MNPGLTQSPHLHCNSKLLDFVSIPCFATISSSSLHRSVTASLILLTLTHYKVLAVGPEASTLAARPARFQYDDGQRADGGRVSRLGGEQQLHLPSHSSTGLSLQQSPLLPRPANTNARSMPQPANLTEHGAPQQSREEVGDTSLLHQPVAATAHTSSGSSACESFLSLCRCC